MLRFLWILVALCAMAGAAGAWNYRRNAHMDVEDLSGRPYHNLADRDLGLLEEAYRQELASYVKKVAQYERATAAAGNLAGGVGDLKDKVETFERVQATAERMRQVQGAMREREVEIENLKREREFRSRPVPTRWDRIVRRVTTF
jgi:hypothetical protein